MIPYLLKPTLKLLVAFALLCATPLLSPAQDSLNVGVWGANNDLPRRDTLPLQIAIDASHTYTDTIKGGPFILPDSTLEIYSGEYVQLELETSGTTITRIKSVKVNAHPEKTIVLHLSPNIQDLNRPGAQLEIRNPFPYRLSYEARTFSAKRKKWRKENPMPVTAKMTSPETYTDPIVKVSLSNWKLQ